MTYKCLQWEEEHIHVGTIHALPPSTWLLNITASNMSMLVWTCDIQMPTREEHIHCGDWATCHNKCIIPISTCTVASRKAQYWAAWIMSRNAWGKGPWTGTVMVHNHDPLSLPVEEIVQNWTTVLHGHSNTIWQFFACCYYRRTLHLCTWCIFSAQPLNPSFSLRSNWWAAQYCLNSPLYIIVPIK